LCSCPYHSDFLQRACALHTVPNLYKPNAATALKPMGNGFAVLIALGILLPASTRLANSASSTPYGWRLRIRKPPRPYCVLDVSFRYYSSMGGADRVVKMGCVKDIGDWIGECLDGAY